MFLALLAVILVALIPCGLWYNEHNLCAMFLVLLYALGCNKIIALETNRPDKLPGYWFVKFTFVMSTVGLMCGVPYTLYIRWMY